MLGYLIQPFIQIQDMDGKPISGARVYIYNANTTNPADTFSDFEGNRNTFPIITDMLGNFTAIADSNRTYDVIVKDNNDILLFSQKNLSVSFAGEDGREHFEQGYGINFETVGNTTVIKVDTSVIATADDLALKQDKLIAGKNIGIDSHNRISVVGRKELVSSYPIRMARGENTLKFYLDQDFIDSVSNFNVLAGANIRIDEEEDGTRIIGVDTDGVSEGNKNFVAGLGTYAKGNYNAVFGSTNSVTGDQNILAGAHNTVGGDRNAVFGYSNLLSTAYSTLVAGTNNKAYGSSLLITGFDSEVHGTGSVSHGYSGYIAADNSFASGLGLKIYNSENAVVGKYNDHSQDTLFAVGIGTADNDRANAFQVGKDGVIKYRYNGGLVQLVPSGMSAYHTTATASLSGQYTGQTVSLGKYIPAGSKFTGTITIKDYTADYTLDFIHIGTPGYTEMQLSLGATSGSRNKCTTYTLPAYVDNTSGSSPAELWFTLRGEPVAGDYTVYINGVLL